MQAHKFKQAWHKELVGLLRKASTEDLAEGFLNVLLTAQERKELALRVQIIKRLNKGETQREIADELGVGIATVTRGARERKFRKTKFWGLIK